MGECVCVAMLGASVAKLGKRVTRFDVCVARRGTWVTRLSVRVARLAVPVAKLDTSVAKLGASSRLAHLNVIRVPLEKTDNRTNAANVLARGARHAADGSSQQGPAAMRAVSLFQYISFRNPTSCHPTPTPSFPWRVGGWGVGGGAEV